MSDTPINDLAVVLAANSRRWFPDLHKTAWGATIHFALGLAGEVGELAAETAEPHHSQEAADVATYAIDLGHSIGCDLDAAYANLPVIVGNSHKQVTMQRRAGHQPHQESQQRRHDHRPTCTGRASPGAVRGHLQQPRRWINRRSDQRQTSNLRATLGYIMNGPPTLDLAADGHHDHHHETPGPFLVCDQCVTDYVNRIRHNHQKALKLTTGCPACVERVYVDQLQAELQDVKPEHDCSLSEPLDLILERLTITPSEIARLALGAQWLSTWMLNDLDGADEYNELGEEAHALWTTEIKRRWRASITASVPA